jgi:serine/threonine-protein kinase
VTIQSPIPQDSAPDSEPAPLPSLPDAADWGDSDIGVPFAPRAAFSTHPRDDGPADPRTTIGHIGRYGLKYRIGEGGLGTVYAAHDPLLSRLIAIKTLNLEVSADQRPSFIALFLDEARAAAGLSHPHIVTVFDAGVSDDNAYIAMELLKGRDLRQLRAEGWRPTPTQAALIVRRVADALAYAHSKGIVHRDVKPANIFMVGRTQPRVLDFGIARVTHQHESHADDDIAGGSPYYMSPEQVRQQPADRRSDVFSLGVVLYELLCDEKPFQGGSLSEITGQVLDHVPPPANLVDPKVPKALSDIAARAMQKDPEHRFRSARALSRELRHWLDEHGHGHASESETAGGPAPVRRMMAAAAIAGLALAALAWWAVDRAAAPPAAAPRPLASRVNAAAPALAAPAPALAPAPASTPLPPAVAAHATACLSDTRAAQTVSPAATAKEPGAAPASKETPRERRARERRERVNTRLAAAPALQTGSVRLAISPWGPIEVDGAPAGHAPPLNELSLPEGRHQITIRNDDFPPFDASVDVAPGQPIVIKHKFGS